MGSDVKNFFEKHFLVVFMALVLLNLVLNLMWGVGHLLNANPRAIVNFLAAGLWMALLYRINLDRKSEQLRAVDREQVNP